MIEDVGDRDGRPHVGHVERRPYQTTDQENRNVEVGENLELFAKEVEWDRQKSANGKTPQETVVDGARSKHLPRTESTPKDRSSEERVVSRTGEVILLIGQTDIWNLRHLVVEDRCADEGRDKSGPHLATECDPRGNVHVMSELEILSEMESLRGCDVPVRLEIIHSGGIAREPKTTEELGDNVQGNLDVCDGHYDTARDAKNYSEEDCKGS